MKICINGWYFFPELLERLAESGYSTTFVTSAIRVQTVLGRIAKIRNLGMEHVIRPPGGLEFGGYDFYIKNLWDGESPVLFMHDDIEVHGSVAPFDQIAALECDQAYIFRDIREEEVNGRIHGRAIYCSADFIRFALQNVCECKEAHGYQDPHHEGNWLVGIGPHNGFWWDRNNMDSHVSGKVPRGLRHYNCGIYHFHGQTVKAAAKAGMRVNAKVHIWNFEPARRGMLGYVRREHREQERAVGSP